ncbi:MAG: replicative DNA helicase, partial [Chitinophagaceae bacterium]
MAEINLKDKSKNNIRSKNNRSPKESIPSLLYGKIPPHDTELEELILGAIMLEKGAFDMVSEILKPECFYLDKHQKIFIAMRHLVSQSQPIDIVSVKNELESLGDLDIVGGAYYIAQITNNVYSTAHLEMHARILLQKFIQRELISIGSTIIKDASENTTQVFNLLDSAEDSIFKITQNYLRSDYQDIDKVLVDTYKRIEHLRTHQEDLSGVPSGFSHLDKITNGWQSTDLIILAARPSVGKTAFALNLIRNAALHPKKPIPVGIFSLEMSSAQLVQRLLAAESKISNIKISRGQLQPHEVEQLKKKGINRLTNSQIFIDDTAALNIFELRAKCRRMVNKHKVGLIVIDYLQLMNAISDNKNGNREQEISRISRELKGLAKDLNVPIIALSQLNRSVEGRKESKVPMLSDLRESGAIEQDADMVLF